MVPQSKPRKRRGSSKTSLFISFIFHGTIVLLLVYFAAREGLLGKQLKKITIEMVKDKVPEKPKEPEKPKDQPPKVEPLKLPDAPKIVAPREVAKASVPAPSIVAPPAVAPPPTEVPSFDFEGGKTVQSSSDPAQLYKGFVEYSIRSKWVRPDNVPDDNYVAEVEIAVDSNGKISNPQWKKTSGDSRWDDSVKAAIAATSTLDRSPPKDFPAHVVIRFDVQDSTEAVFQ